MLIDAIAPPVAPPKPDVPTPGKIDPPGLPKPAKPLPLPWRRSPRPGEPGPFPDPRRIPTNPPKKQ